MIVFFGDVDRFIERSRPVHAAFKRLTDRNAVYILQIGAGGGHAPAIQMVDALDFVGEAADAKRSHK